VKDCKIEGYWPVPSPTGVDEQCNCQDGCCRSLNWQLVAALGLSRAINYFPFISLEVRLLTLQEVALDFHDVCVAGAVATGPRKKSVVQGVGVADERTKPRVGRSLAEGDHVKPTSRAKSVDIDNLFDESKVTKVEQKRKRSSAASKRQSTAQQASVTAGLCMLLCL